MTYLHNDLLFRYVSLQILAKIKHTVATVQLSASTWGISPILCTSVNVGQAMLVMDSSVGKTQIWMDGPIVTWSVLPMLLITA